MNDLNTAKDILKSGGFTCVLCKGETVVTSKERGVKPLYNFLLSGNDFSFFSASDKVVGKATAFLYVLLKVKAVYAAVISAGALEVLKANGIDAEYDTLVPNIINRKGDGICPFERTVMEIDDPETALTRIKMKLKEMNII